MPLERVVLAAALGVMAAVGLTVWAALAAGARAEEEQLRARGCTCPYPRESEHEGRCPLFDPAQQAGA